MVGGRLKEGSKQMTLTITWKRIGLVLLVLAASLVALAATKSTAQAPKLNEGRYTLQSAKTPGMSKAGNIEAYDELFLLDSATGTVWKYNPYTSVTLPEGGKFLEPSHFEIVFIDD